MYVFMYAYIHPGTIYASRNLLEIPWDPHLLTPYIGEWQETNTHIRYMWVEHTSILCFCCCSTML